MSERDEHDPGVPCWVDHSSPDPSAAAEFYGGLFGWESEDQMPPDSPGRYFFANLRGRGVAALGTQMAKDAPPMWNTYMAAENADDVVVKVREAGGTAYGEAFDVFGAGRMAVLADTSGAPFCVWQAREHQGAALVNEPGTLCWNELLTRDTDGSKRFYSRVFGWQTSAIDAGGFEYTLLHPASAAETSPGSAMGGMMPMQGFWPDEVSPNWLIYFAVEDADAIARRCEKLGGSVFVRRIDTPQGPMAVLSDPQGAMFAVIALTVPTK